MHSGAKCLWAAAIGMALILSSASQAQAGFEIGSSYTVTATNAPNTFTQNVTLAAGTTTIDGGLLTLTQSLYTVGGNQWLILNFQATSGILAGNVNNYWQLGAQNVTLDSPAEFIGGLVYFTVNGVATEPITPFANNFTSIGTDPVNPSVGNVYLFQFSGAPLTSINAASTLQPYSLISQGGMNPSLVNGYVEGIEIQGASVPEPSSLILLGLGLAAVSGNVWNRRRIRRAASVMTRQSASLVILAVLALMPSAVSAASTSRAIDAQEEFSEARSEAISSFRDFQEAQAECNEIVANEAAIKLLNDQIAERAREIGRLNLYIEQIDNSGPTRRNSVMKGERQAALARQMALRDEQQEDRKQLSLRTNARQAPARKQQVFNDRQSAVNDLREKADRLRAALDEVSSQNAEDLGLDSKGKKKLASQITESRNFLKEVEPVIRPQARRTASRRK